MAIQPNDDHIELLTAPVPSLPHVVRGRLVRTSLAPDAPAGAPSAHMFVGNLVRASEKLNETAASFLLGHDLVVAAVRSKSVDSLAKINADTTLALAYVWILDGHEYLLDGHHYRAVCNVRIVAGEPRIAQRALRSILRFVASQVAPNTVGTSGSESELIGPTNILLSAYPTKLAHLFDGIKSIWFEGMYNMYTCNAHSSPDSSADTAVALSASASANETLVVDNLRPQDIDAIMQGSTIDYSMDYLNELVHHPTLSKTSFVVRSIPISEKTSKSENASDVDPNQNANMLGVPVSWILSHNDFSAGLLATRKSHRGRGLASICMRQIIPAQIATIRRVLNEYLASDADQDENTHLIDTMAQTFCFVKDGNEASAAVMRSCGFTVVEQSTYQWVGIDISQLPN